jgi:hypothetical protein
MANLDLLLINPGGRELIYQDLSADLSAIKPSLWCRLMPATSWTAVLQVTILDYEAENKGPAERSLHCNDIVGIVAAIQKDSST